jgi:formate--tetrahydrofolate ligase
MMALLNEALLPNLVQTAEGTPAMVHCGPFANIAHGTSSVLSQKIGMRLADYVVNEAGFASDLGFEKYMNLVSPMTGIKPSVAVVVTTVKSLKQQGEGDLTQGAVNLKKHIAIVRASGLPAVVAINRFSDDTLADLDSLRSLCESSGAAFALSDAFAMGGEGAMALAQKVVDVIDANPDVHLTPVYQSSDSALEKITKVAQRVYGADAIELSETATENLARFTRWGFGHLPICIAKTQYSLSDDPARLGAPTGWTLHVTDIALSAGAGFLVVVAGSIMLMPGLPKAPRALAIDVDEHGLITGLQ